MAYGTVNADVIGTSVTGSNLGAGNASLMKNRIINGAMVIDQRNAGASVTPTAGQYTLDRYIAQASQPSKFSVQQNAGSVTPPAGFSNYLGVTSLSAYSVGSAENFEIQQKIEGFNCADLGWGTANAKTVTLSFQVYSSLTGTFGGFICNSATNYSYPFSYSIPVANTWTTISITIAGPTAGTWVGATNGVGMFVGFSLGAGSTTVTTGGSWNNALYRGVTGQQQIVGTNGATFYITGVQLEVGSSATGFEYRQYQQELALCQRYTKVFISSSSTGGVSASTTTAQQRFIPPVTMRSAPTATISTSGSWTISDDYTGDYTATTVTINSYNASVDLVRTVLGGFTGLTSGRFVGGSPGGGTAQILLSAEL